MDRLGYSFDWIVPIVPYVTAGMAAGRLEANVAGIPLGRQSANNVGWTVGAGVEMVIGCGRQNWSFCMSTSMASVATWPAET